MSMSGFARNTIQCLALILKKSPGNAIELFPTYIRLKFKYILLEKILKVAISEEKIFGFRMRLFNYQDFLFMFEEIFINKDYYFDAKQDNPLIIDCGSNIGMAVIFFKKLYPEAEITSFEPSRKTFEVLRHNVQVNNLKNVELVNKAVYDSEGMINFYHDPDRPGLPLMGARTDGGLLKLEGKVDSVPLSDYIRKKVDFLKIDIEGSEDLVIEELARKNKLRSIREIVIEYHYLKAKEDRLAKILRILGENGFGYQVKTFTMSPFSKEKRYDRLIYAYQRLKT